MYALTAIVREHNNVDFGVDVEHAIYKYILKLTNWEEKIDTLNTTWTPHLQDDTKRKCQIWWCNSNKVKKL